MSPILVRDPRNLRPRHPHQRGPPEPRIARPRAESQNRDNSKKRPRWPPGRETPGVEGDDGTVRSRDFQVFDLERSVAPPPIPARDHPGRPPGFARGTRRENPGIPAVARPSCLFVAEAPAFSGVAEVAMVKGETPAAARTWLSVPDGTALRAVVHVSHDLPHL